MNKWKGKFSKEPWLMVSGHAIDYKTTIVWWACDELVEVVMSLWWACWACDHRLWWACWGCDNR